MKGTVVKSNYFEEFNVGTIGLDSDAYFIYGNRDYVYFAHNSSQDYWYTIYDGGTVAIYEFSIANKSIRKCAECQHSVNVVKTYDGKTFYFFGGSDKGGGEEMNYFTYKCDIGDTTATLEYEQTMKASRFVRDLETYAHNYIMEENPPYGWYRSNGKLMLTNGIKDLDYSLSDKNITDEVWNLTKAQDSFSISTPPSEDGTFVFRTRYSTFLDYYISDTYFSHTFGEGEVHFLFAEECEDSFHVPWSVYVVS